MGKQKIVRPIGVFQHDADAPPAYFAVWAAEAGLPVEIIRVDRGEPVPVHPERFSGLCFLGGSMSVNDPLPWIARTFDLICAADAAGVPVLGHCLGGQLLARALGGAVTRHSVKELGWGELRVTDTAVARDWLGVDDADPLGTFQWHGDRFELPPNARNFLSSPYCVNQAFVVERGGYAHLGLQFHCEMTAELVTAWAADPNSAREVEDELVRTGGPAVQSLDAMRSDLDNRVAQLNRFAARLYSQWAKGLVCD
ncbi:MAG TPA: type 1 glutamine amidotransferase [Burkholderiaceae bacterium]|nr:type 1 glutamine amidotransferase [Burkholderiaceae bacterium]